MIESRYDGSTKVTQYEEPETAAEAAARAVRDPRNREVLVMRGATQAEVRNRQQEVTRRARAAARRGVGSQRRQQHRG